MSDRPAWFNRGIAVLLAAGALTFAGLLAGVGSGIITDEPDESASIYAGGRPAEQPSGPVFAITRIEFGAAGLVEITNRGDASGSMEGWFLCQRPSYHALPGTTLGPGESVTIQAAAASIGELEPADGEMGLYSSASFGDPAAIVSYVEWGAPGHGRSAVAVDAGIWPDGGFVPGGGDRIVGDGAAGPEGWSS